MPPEPNPEVIDPIITKHNTHLPLLLIAVAILLASATILVLLRTPKPPAPTAQTPLQNNYDYPTPIHTPYPSNNYQPSKPTPTPTTIPPTQIIQSNQITITSPKLIKSSKNSNEDFSNQIEVYSIGKVLDGDFKNSIIIMGKVFHQGACKGSRCDAPVFFRGLLQDKELTFLNYNSEFNYSPSDIYFNDEESFSALGYKITPNADLSLTPFEYPQQLVYQGQKFNYNFENEAKVDLSILYKVFSHPLGDVYTTRPEKSPQRFFYSNDDVQPYPRSFGMGAVSSCVSQDCFINNGLFIFRPDGTYLQFSMAFEFPDDASIDWHPQAQIPKEQITLTNNEVSANYNYATRYGCSDDYGDVLSVISPEKVSNTDLQPTGKIVSSNQLVYELSKNHPLYNQFLVEYNKYKNSWHKLDDQIQPDYTLDQFVVQIPILIIKDVFGRNIRLTNNRFTPPLACEPIIYLYPETPTKVTVELPNPTEVIASHPQYGNKWAVTAYPDGNISLNNQNYEYLFWEGMTGFWPRNTEGFVVAVDNVEKFFITTLPKFGLNEKETADFVSAWAPDLKNAPFYKISFYAKSIIDKNIPLKVSPQPDTIIRILMDYEPLLARINIPEPKLPKTPLRQGFTVVEWGGLKR